MSKNDEKKPVPVNVDNINLDLLKLKVADMPSLLEYAHTVGGFAITPTNEGAIKSTARSAMVEQTEEQLKMIFEQMQTLAKQVQDIKKRVYISDLIYNVHIPFTPVIGKTYYLYEEEASKRFLSLLSPEEWGERSDHIFLAEIKLNADHTWKVVRSTIEFN